MKTNNKPNWIDTFDKVKIFKHDYFYDFDKIQQIIEENIDIFNKFTNININTVVKLENSFRSILTLNPELTRILPYLMAFSISKHDKGTFKFDDYDFLFNMNEIIDIDEFIYCLKTSGYLDFLVNNKISNIYSFVCGIIVGNNTNSRKNRSGKRMEEIVGDYLENNFNKKF